MRSLLAHQDGMAGWSARRRATPLWLQVFLPLAIVLATVALRFAAPAAYTWLVVEDGPVEWATSLGYVIAAVLAGLVAARLWRIDRALAVAYLVLVAGFLVIAGEEASWGQRVFGFKGPERLVELNKQDEANIHNLMSRRYLHALYIGVGLYGAFAARLLPPLVGRFRAVFLAPGRRLAGWFLVPTLLYVYYDFVSPVMVRVFGEGAGWSELNLLRVQEVAELVLCVGFVLFVCEAIRTVRCVRRDATPLPAAAVLPVTRPTSPS